MLTFEGRVSSHLALNANFRTRRKKVSSEENDPSLGDGWSSFVNAAIYYAYLVENRKTKQPRNTCVAHDTVDRPDREWRETASSGIATGLRPPQPETPEFGINMDYLFFIGLAGRDRRAVRLACQWHNNIWERSRGHAVLLLALLSKDSSPVIAEMLPSDRLESGREAKI
ncbi:hypothetical protein DFH06DRAFT_1347761 [Mycena polygramma]|nr:hypothetical protein DFH06DRAFT_1347761 [Mycena polygramma]